MATQEIDSTLPVVTQEHMTTVEVPRGSGEPEEAMPSLSSVSAEVDDAELSRRWESLATPASTTVVPLSLQLTSSMEGQQGNVGSVFEGECGSLLLITGMREAAGPFTSIHMFPTWKDGRLSLLVEML